MGALRDTGKISLTLLDLKKAEQPRDLLLEAVQEEAAGEYTVFGEIARGAGGSVLYLARDLVDNVLAILRLTPAFGVSDEYSLELVKQLDESVPAPDSKCPRCAAPLRQWGRFCSMCGTDLWSDPSFGGEYSREEMLEAVKEAAGGKYEILGEMPRAEGGGFVFFGRDLATGKITALRLLSEGQGEYSIGLTGLLKRVATSVSPRKPSVRRQPARPSSAAQWPREPTPEQPPLDSLFLDSRRVPRADVRPPRRPAPKPAARDEWAVLQEFLGQPRVQAFILIALAVALVSLCWVAIIG